MMNTAEKLETLAYAIQKAIDHAQRPMTQNPTPKRNKEYRSRLHDGNNLERTQRALRCLAAAHRAGTVPSCLAGLTTKAAIAPLVHKSLLHNGGYYDVIPDREYYDKSPTARAMQELMEHGTPDDERAAISRRAEQAEADRIKADLQLSKIPGYFPTPAAIADRMVDLADIKPEHVVLEPSAGTGALIEAIRRKCAACTIRAVELRPTIVDVLRRRAFRCGEPDKHIAIMQGDFLESNGELGKFDRIVMNPPFDHGADVKHIQHALTHLRPGGRLVAICAGGPRQRHAMREIGARWIDLPHDAFKESGTGVSSAIVVIEG